MKDNQAKYPQLRFKGFTDPWEERKLSELATMNARIGWQNLRTSEFLDNGDYMLITGTDFKAGAIDYSNIHYVEKERFEQDKKIQISNKSILITKDGTLGKVAYVEGLTMPATLNAGVFNVKVKEDLAIDSKYLFHYLKAPFLLKFADQRSTGGTIKHLNQNVLVEFPIPLPSLGEQHKIAGLLSNFDNTIALHQRKLAKLKELKQGYLQKLFPKNGSKFPQLRFAGFADAWEQRKFKDNIVSIQTGTNLLGSAVNEGTPLIKMGNLQRGYFSFKKLEYLDSNSNVGSEDIVNYGDFLFNTRNTLELVGKGATWTGISGKYAFNSNIARFKFDGIDTIFFNYLYNTQQVISQVHARAVGTTSVSAVYPRDLNSLLYYLPSIEEGKFYN